MADVRSIAIPRLPVERLHSDGGMLALGALVGAVAGLGAVAFREVILSITWIVTGRSDYGAGGRLASLHALWAGPWFLIVVPVLGGIVYGPLISRFAPEARGHGVPEVMVAVSRAGGRIRPRVAFVKAAASAVCIGTGGSVGREGPIVQIGSAAASAVGQVLRLPESRLRLLVACGAAAGISATFNAPVAGVFFAVELIIRDVEVDSFATVVLASVTADVIGRAAFGATPFLALPEFHQHSVLGLRLVRRPRRHRSAGRRWFHPHPVHLRGRCRLGLAGTPMDATGRRRAGAGMSAAGRSAAVRCRVSVIHDAVAGRYVVGFLLFLVVAKIAATSLTIAIGGSGAACSPRPCSWARCSAAPRGAMAHSLTPAVAGPPGAYGLVGMAAVFASGR